MRLVRIIIEGRINKNQTYSFGFSYSKIGQNANFDFIKNRKKYYILSSVIIIAGMVAMFGGGLMGNLGSGIGDWIGGGGISNMFGGGTTGSNSAYTTRLTNSNNNVGNLGTGTYSNYNSFMA
jgi:hypothetical protein